MWTMIAVAVCLVATAFDYHWLKTFAWPLYVIQLGLLVVTLAIGGGVGGTSRWVSIFGLQFQFSELAKVLMIVVLANYLGSRMGRLGSLWSIVGAGHPRGAAVHPRACSSRTSGRPSSSGRSSPRRSSCRARACAGWRSSAAAGIAMLPFVWSYVLADYQKARLTSFLDPLADIQGSGLPAYQSQIAVGSGGWFGKGLTNGDPERHGPPAGPGHRLRVRDPRRGGRVRRRRGRPAAVRRAAVARPRRRLALEGPVRDRSSPAASRRGSCSSCS